MPSITHRQDYEKASLDESSVDRDPIRQFQAWFDQATEAGIAEPHAATVATASPEGRPSARIVLIRGFDDRGFVFYTNYRSRRGREIEANPFASICFFWQPMERQVRVEGSVVRASEAESDEYFQGRPLGSKLGAWVSNQSGVVASREAPGPRWSPFSALPRRRGPPTAALGRIPDRAGVDRGLARAEEPTARPPDLSENARWRLADRSVGAP